MKHPNTLLAIIILLIDTMSAFLLAEYEQSFGIACRSKK